ncbi:unnamed protein product, partial [marine sediment metagenome]
MFAGIDIGAATTKAVIIEREEIVAFSLIPTSYDREQSGAEVLNLALDKIQKSEDAVKYIVSTGYGRRAFASSD